MGGKDDKDQDSFKDVPTPQRNSLRLAMAASRDSYHREQAEQRAARRQSQPPARAEETVAPTPARTPSRGRYIIQGPNDPQPVALTPFVTPGRSRFFIPGPHAQKADAPTPARTPNRRLFQTQAKGTQRDPSHKLATSPPRLSDARNVNTRTTGRAEHENIDPVTLDHANTLLSVRREVRHDRPVFQADVIEGARTLLSLGQEARHSDDEEESLFVPQLPDNDDGHMRARSHAMTQWVRDARQAIAARQARHGQPTNITAASGADEDGEWWVIKEIYDQRPDGQILVAWKGVNPATGEEWPKTWVKKKDLNMYALDYFESKMGRRGQN